MAVPHPAVAQVGKPFLAVKKVLAGIAQKISAGEIAAVFCARSNGPVQLKFIDWTDSGPTNTG